MRCRDALPALRRTATFETFEARLVMSTAPPVELWSTDANLLEQPLADIRQSLSQVHAATGVDYVRQQFGFAGAGQTVAVIDSGIAYDHAALGRGFGTRYRVVGGWDFAENDANPYDDGPAGFHGTHVAGIVGSDHALHVGVAPRVDLVALRVFDDQGMGNFDWIEKALRWVHEHRHSFPNPITTVNLSLGADWNANVLPNWATLEDEFAQLKSAGVFIAVAAGNAFSDYQQPGLSYPAVSPHVVPVASAGEEGTLSNFSQRHERVLAAPGESMTSTVPDFVFGADGVKNDFASASGTSMAAPYVAGASILIREALQFVGREAINQDVIYQHLLTTADTVFDPATQASYRHLNLRRAIDALMPVDDYGDTLGTAHRLGTLHDTMTLAGRIGHARDRDIFTFTAGQTGTVRFTAGAVGDWTLHAALSESSGSSRGGTWTFDVVAGATYSLVLSAEEGTGTYEARLAFESAIVNWGPVDFQRLLDQNLTRSETWYQLIATRSGILTVEALFSRAAGNLDLRLSDVDARTTADGQAHLEGTRVDMLVEAGGTYLLKVTGVHSDVDFRLTNLLSPDGGILRVAGTDRADRFEVNVHDQTIRVNEVGYGRHQLGHISSVQIQGDSGFDRVIVHGSSFAETALLQVGSVQVTGGTWQVSAAGVEGIRVHGGGGSDRAVMYDSAGDDRFILRPDMARLLAAGTENRVYDFDRVTAYASSGNDLATLYDSTGNDQFLSQPGYARMWGMHFDGNVHGFGSVYAVADAGGQDQAVFYDSAGDDVFVSRAEFARLTTGRFLSHGRGFDHVYSMATAGGRDVAYFYDSAGSDQLTVRPEYVRMFGLGYDSYAAGFETAHAYCMLGGADHAAFYDSLSNDTLLLRGQEAILTTPLLEALARGFASVSADATRGGMNTVASSAIDFVLSLRGDWRHDEDASTR